MQGNIPLQWQEVTVALTALTDNSIWHCRAAAVLVYGLSIMSHSVSIYFGPRTGWCLGWVFCYRISLQEPWEALVWQIYLTEVNVASVADKWYVHTPSPFLYSLSLSFTPSPSFFVRLHFLICVGLWEAFKQLRRLDYVTVQLPCLCWVSVCWCRYSCLISVGGLRVEKRSECIDFIDSRVHGFCFASPCWIIDWIANAYD